VREFNPASSSKSDRGKELLCPKRRGFNTGRKPTLSYEDMVRLKELISMGMSKAKAARDFKISRETVYQHLKN
jgi:DNA invertase Pin-like site-specific DNA recombinase